MRRDRVLIVDDYRDQAETYGEYFEQSGFDVRLAFNGREGVEIAERWQPDIVLLDIVMPILDGFGVLDELKRRGVATRVLMFSGNAVTLKDAVRAIKAGACDYVSKPILPEEVADLLRKYVLTEDTINLRVVDRARGLPRSSQPAPTRAPKGFSKRVFIVHGHDDALKSDLARLLERLDLVPVILHEQPDRGNTVIEKLRAELKDVAFAIVLLTPDDVGTLSGEGSAYRPRARQNVLFEHGLLIGLLGADRVCAIRCGEVELPSDLHGVLYKTIPIVGTIASVSLEIVNELRAAGFLVDSNRLLSPGLQMWPDRALQPASRS